MVGWAGSRWAATQTRRLDSIWRGERKRELLVVLQTGAFDLGNLRKLPKTLEEIVNKRKWVFSGNCFYRCGMNFWGESVT
jgi:hypothetical protein